MLVPAHTENFPCPRRKLIDFSVHDLAEILVKDLIAGRIIGGGMSLPCDSRVIFLADVSTDVIDYPVAGRREKVRTERTFDTKPVTIFPDIDEAIVEKNPCPNHGSKLCGNKIDPNHT